MTDVGHCIVHLSERPAVHSLAFVRTENATATYERLKNIEQSNQHTIYQSTHCYRDGEYSPDCPASNYCSAEKPIHNGIKSAQMVCITLS